MNALRLIIRVTRISIVRILILLLDSMLEIGDAFGIVYVLLPTVTPVILSGLGHPRGDQGLARRPAALMEFECIHGKEIKSRPLNTTSRTNEETIDNFTV